MIIIIFVNKVEHSLHIPINHFASISNQFIAQKKTDQNAFSHSGLFYKSVSPLFWWKQVF